MRKCGQQSSAPPPWRTRKLACACVPSGFPLPLDLGAQALLLRAQFRCELLAEVLRLEEAVESRAPIPPLGMESAQRLAEVDLVDQPGCEVLANGGNATAEPDILALAGGHQVLQRSEPAPNPATNEGQLDR